MPNPKRSQNSRTIEQPLLVINQLPSFPDETTTEKLKNTLEEIRSKSSLITSVRFEGIKRTLLTYSDKANQLHSNMGLKEKLNLLVNNNQAFGLVEEIRAIIQENLNKKKTKDINEAGGRAAPSA